MADILLELGILDYDSAMLGQRGKCSQNMREAFSVPRTTVFMPGL